MNDDAYIERHMVQDGKSVYYIGAHAGSHISNAASSALGLMFTKAERHGHDNVCGFIEFNGLLVPLNQGDTAEDVCASYMQMSDERQAEYEKSDEYKRQQEEAARHLIATQAKLDETVNDIEALCGDWAARSQLHPNGLQAADLFGLLITYIDAADLVGVDKRAERVRAALESVGYRKNHPHPMQQQKDNVVQSQQDYRAFAAGLILGSLGMINPHFGPQIEKWELHLLH